MQKIDYNQHLLNSRNASAENHLRWQRNTSGAFYRRELGLSRIPTEYRATVASLPAVRPTIHQERRTDEYNLKDLGLTHLLNLYISLYQCRHHCLPSIISLSPSNMTFLEMQGFRHSIYRNELGVFLLFCDDQLNDDTILCS